MNSLETALHLVDRLELGQEPLVNVRHLPDLVDAVAAVERGVDSEDALVRWVHQLLVDVLHKVVLTRIKNSMPHLHTK